MLLSPLQYACLDKMGIVVFEPSRPKKIDYLVAIESESEAGLPAEQEALLTRIFLALHWPAHAICRWYFKASAVEQLTLTLAQKRSEIQPKHTLVFSESKKQIEHALHVSSLKSILTDVEAKRRAWKIMQPYSSSPSSGRPSSIPT